MSQDNQTQVQQNKQQQKGSSGVDMNAMIKYKIDENEITLTPEMVQKFILGSEAVKITLPEFFFFASLCKARKLNPFTRECYIIKYSDKEPAQIVVSKDVFVDRAVKHPEYDGKETGVFVLKKDGTLEERQGCLVLPEEKLVGGWARVYRRDKSHPEYMSVSLEEVAQHKGDGQLNKNWRDKPATMVEKVAKARALREAFTDEMKGMVSEDEATVIDITPDTPPALTEGEQQKPNTGAKKVNIDEV